MRKPFQKGHPQYGGRAKGTPNRVSVDAQVLAKELVMSPVYQARLRRDFERRKLHPTIEGLVWNYGLGKPVQPVLMGGSVGLDVTTRHVAEREAFAALDVATLEHLAAKSQQLVDEALDLARNRSASLPESSAAEGRPTDESETGPKGSESDRNYSVNLPSLPASSDKPNEE